MSAFLDDAAMQSIAAENNLAKPALSRDAPINVHTGETFFSGV